MPTQRSDLFVLVCDAILSLNIPGVKRETLRPDSLLVTDVGLDSLRFVDLTVSLEDTLELEEFPMQDWVDRQIAHQRPLNISELQSECDAILSEAGRQQ